MQTSLPPFHLADCLTAHGGAASVRLYGEDALEYQFSSSHHILVRATPTDSTHSTWHCRAWGGESTGVGVTATLNRELAILGLLVEAETENPLLEQIIRPTIPARPEGSTLTEADYHIDALLWSLRCFGRTAVDGDNGSDYTVVESIS